MKEEINRLFEKLDWNKPHKVQEETIKKLQTIKDLNIFMQPTGENAGKKVWENCARILLKKSDKELLPYLKKLLEWLQDRNWPGEYIIRYRIQKIPWNKVESVYIECIEEAKNNKDDIWLENLESLYFKKRLK